MQKSFLLMRIPLQHTISILFMPLARTAVETARITVQVTCSSKTKPEMQIETLKNQQSMIAVTSNITSEDIVCTVPDLALIRSVGSSFYISHLPSRLLPATRLASPYQCRFAESRLSQMFTRVRLRTVTKKKADTLIDYPR